MCGERAMNLAIVSSKNVSPFEIYVIYLIFFGKFIHIDSLKARFLNKTCKANVSRYC
jgi:hypothetical protein